MDGYIILGLPKSANTTFQLQFINKPYQKERDGKSSHRTMPNNPEKIIFQGHAFQSIKWNGRILKDVTPSSPDYSDFISV